MSGSLGGGAGDSEILVAMAILQPLLACLAALLVKDARDWLARTLRPGNNSELALIAMALATAAVLVSLAPTASGTIPLTLHLLEGPLVSSMVSATATLAGLGPAASKVFGSAVSIFVNMVVVVGCMALLGTLGWRLFRQPPIDKKIVRRWAGPMLVVAAIAIATAIGPNGDWLPSAPSPAATAPPTNPSPQPPIMLPSPAPRPNPSLPTLTSPIIVLSTQATVTPTSIATASQVAAVWILVSNTRGEGVVSRQVCKSFRAPVWLPAVTS